MIHHLPIRTGSKSCRCATQDTMVCRFVDSNFSSLAVTCLMLQKIPDRELTKSPKELHDVQYCDACRSWWEILQIIKMHHASEAGQWSGQTQILINLNTIVLMTVWRCGISTKKLAATSFSGNATTMYISTPPHKRRHCFPAPHQMTILVSTSWVFDSSERYMWQNRLRRIHWNK